MMQKMRNNTICVFDWDDSLYPSNHIISKGIDLTNPSTQTEYISLFSKLDTTLHNLFTSLLPKAQIVIITNAVKKWVDISLATLPKTQLIVNKHIPVISARDLHKQQHPTNMSQWKKLTFKNLAQKNPKFTNIISVGDAEYEYLATIELYDNMAHSNNKLLKTIRMFPSPSFESLINQLNMLSSNFSKIISCNRHLDLKFK
jgi:hypothetical protein